MVCVRQTTRQIAQCCKIFELERERRIPLFSKNELDARRRGGLMVCALDSGSSGPGSSPGQGHCVMFLGKTLYFHSSSFHPGPGCSKPD